MELGVVPVVNENDAIADDEIRFGDNDRLSALVAARGEFELHVTRPGGVRPIIVRRVRFEVPLTGTAPELGGPMAPLPVDANAAGLVVQEPVVLVSAEHVYFAGVRLANRGSAPVVVPLFGLLHAAADFGEGDMFPLIGRGTSFGCPHCGPGLGPSVCDYLEGVLLSPADGDIGAIFGLGFPPFRGGPFRYVDTLGAAEVLKRIEAYHGRFGGRWKPAPVLVEMARENRRFYDVR